MKNTLPPQRSVSPSSTLEHRLNLYAIAATSAGVGLFALTCPVEAKVIYTPTHVTVSSTQPLIPLDFNHDFIPDASLSVYAYCFNGTLVDGCAGVITAIPKHQNQILLSGSRFAAADPQGRRIGPGNPFGGLHAEMAECITSSVISGGRHYFSTGAWKKQTNHYLGFRFLISGETHYAWARVTSIDQPRGCGATATITGYAYETEVNKPIAAGDTGSLEDVAPSGDVSPVEDQSNSTIIMKEPTPNTLGRLAAGAGRR
jgi:hypothetical protein